MYMGVEDWVDVKAKDPILAWVPSAEEGQIIPYVWPKAVRQLFDLKPEPRVVGA